MTDTQTDWEKRLISVIEDWGCCSGDTDKILESFSQELSHQATEIVVETISLLDKYDESPDDMAGFEIRIKKPIEFRQALQKIQEKYA